MDNFFWAYVGAMILAFLAGIALEFGYKGVSLFWATMAIAFAILVAGKI